MVDLGISQRLAEIASTSEAISKKIDVKCQVIATAVAKKNILKRIKFLKKCHFNWFGVSAGSEQVGDCVLYIISSDLELFESVTIKCQIPSNC